MFGLATGESLGQRQLCNGVRSFFFWLTNTLLQTSISQLFLSVSFKI